MADILARQRQIIGAESDWGTHDLVLGAGELALVRQGDGSVRARVGDGTSPFSASPFLDGGAHALRYQGNADPTAAPPAGAAPGDAYTASPGGVVAASWGPPAAGETVAEGDLLIMDAEGAWNVAGAAVDTSGFVTRTELAATGAGEGGQLVGFVAGGTGAVPTDQRKKSRERLSLMDFIPAGIWADIEAATNAADLQAYIRAALNTGRDVYCEAGLVFLTSGATEATPNLTHSGQRLWGGGTFKKTGAVSPIFTMADELQGVTFDGVNIDGSRSLYTGPANVPAIKGYLQRSFHAHRCRFFDIIDAAIKLADSAKVSAQDCEFFHIWQNGIELRNYTYDNRIPGGTTPYAGTRPSFEGGHRITGCSFDWIDNGLHGADDGCGVTMDSMNPAYPVLGAAISGCTFMDIKRAISTENHAVGAELRGLAITGNVFNGNIRGVAQVETYVAVGLIGAKGVTVKGNTFRNTGNFDAGASADCASIVVSGAVAADQSSDIVIQGNTFIDDTGAANRTDYHVQLSAGRRIKVLDNIMSGAQKAQIYANPVNVAGIDIRGNLGAEGAYSWGDTATVEFEGQNLAAGTTNQLHPFGFPDDNEFICESAHRVVGISVRLTAAISAGSLTVRTYVDNVEETDLQLVFTSADAPTAAKQIALEQAVTVAANKRIRVDAVGDATFAPVTADIQVSLVRELGMKF